MKQLLLFLMVISSTLLAANDPENIALKTKIIQSQTWYEEQTNLWLEKVNAENTSEAWLNYYMAARYAQKSQNDLTAIERQAELVLNDKFVINLIKAWNAGFTDQALDLLKKCITSNDLHPVANALITLQYEYTLQYQERKQSSERLFRSGAVSESLLSYTYNVLMSVETDGVLITEGDNTTLPIFILQDVFNIRNDVQVLNLDLLLEKPYRVAKLNLAGLKGTEFKVPSSDSERKQQICTGLPTENPDKKFYYALTIGQQNISNIKDQLYIVGLASRLSQKRMDNLSYIKENLENRFLIDHLTVDFDGESSTSAGKVFSTNYLLPIMLLVEHYGEKHDAANVNRWSVVMSRLATERGKAMIIENFLKRGESAAIPFVSANLDTKYIEGSLRNIKGNFYAWNSEVTNAQYNKFLLFLTEQNRTEEYEKYKVDLSRYEEPALALMKNYHAPRQATKKDKYFTNYPIVNITHEAAVAYCEWLTQQYNNTPGRKYKEVKFRLPSVNEWQISALGYSGFQSWNLDENTIELTVPANGKDEICKNCPKKVISMKEADVRYPWYIAYNYRNSPLNSRGCALGNFKWPEDQKPCLEKIVTPDGWVLMSPVESYFPNNLGLYDVVGNVAEMTLEKGKACGGSWNHLPEQSTIRSINEYTGPDASIGFRVFMEVIAQ